MYELMSSDYNVTANQIIWNGARYNRDENGYKRIDNLENIVEIPKDCDVKDIWYRGEEGYCRKYFIPRIR